MKLFKKDVIKKYFKKEDLEKIKNVIGDVEKTTSAELRVKLIRKIDKGVKSVYDQAIHEFVKEKMDLTRDFTGILILIVLEDRKFQILVDKGVMAKIPQKFFDGKAKILSGAFAKGTHVEALLAIISFIGVELATHFPKKPDDKNEIPDDVVVEGYNDEKHWRGQKILTEEEAKKIDFQYGPEPDEPKEEEGKK